MSDLRAPACPAGGERPLTAGEVTLACSIYGGAIDYAPVTIRRRKWFAFQPPHICMTPRGHIHFHPRDRGIYCDDFAQGSAAQQGLFIHEMAHVWQVQTRGEWYLVTRRHPFCRYSYSLKPGWPLERYGIEQQAEIVKHAFWLRRGLKVAGVGDASAYDMLVRFPGADQP